MILRCFGPRQILEAVVGELGKIWRLSEPAWASEGALVTFCGMELARTSYGWRVTQKRYLQELLGRYQVEGSASAPLAKWEEPAEEEPTLEAVRRAQGITGALLWAVTRSRPDMAFVVSRMAQLSTKCPNRVFEIGLQALKYASTTLDLGLEFRAQEGPSFGQEGQLSHSRASNALEVYADASHSPNGERSLQCVIVAWKGSLLLWEATRQAFTTLSTAESELVGMIHAAQVGECVSPVIEELIGDDVVISLLGDNMAALAAYEQGGSSWRNRHLRMRANAGRERVAAGSLFPCFVPGHLQVADIGTKPLPAAKLLGLLSIVNVRLPMEEKGGPIAATVLARMGRIRLDKATEAYPALIAALTLLAQPTGVESMKVLRWSPEVGLCWLLPQLVAGQPTTDLMDFLGIVREVCVGLVVLAAWRWLSWRMDSRTKCPGVEDVEPPAMGGEIPSSSWEAGPFPRGPGEEGEPQEEGEAPTPRATGLEGSRGEIESSQEVCEFPMVGRLDPRANWVPMHYLRGLISLVGEVVFQFVGVYEVEIWRLRAVARTFRYGVASAYERARGIRLTRGTGDVARVYDIAHADVPGPAEEDPELDIDGVRHVLPEEYQGPPIQDVRLWREDAQGSSSSGTDSAWESPETSSEESSSAGNSLQVAPTEEYVGTSAETVNVDGGAPLSVAYRAVDGALIVVYGEEELRVELPGWTMEEVHSIVESIQLGDWTPFHEVMSWEATSSQVDWSVSSVSPQNFGLEPGEIAVGSEGFGISSDLQGFNSRGSLVEGPAQEEQEALASRDVSESTEGELPELEPIHAQSEGTAMAELLEQIGWAGWMGVSGCFCWVCGFCFVVCGLLDGVFFVRSLVCF